MRSGKIFLGGDGAWRWRRGVEDKYHYRFGASRSRMARRILGGEGGHSGDPRPGKTQVGEKVFVAASFWTKPVFHWKTEKSKAWFCTNGQRENLRFTPDEEGPGVYLASPSSGTGHPQHESKHLPTERELSLDLTVERPTKEKLGQPVVSRDLLPRPTYRGEFTDYLNYEKVTQSLSLSSRPPT